MVVAGKRIKTQDKKVISHWSLRKKEDGSKTPLKYSPSSNFTGQATRTRKALRYSGTQVLLFLSLVVMYVWN
ncbi:hypothetical protein FHS86_003615 [Roseimarinus sediminis]